MSKELSTTRELLAYEAIKSGQLLDLMKGNGRYFYTNKNFGGPVDSFEVLDLLYIINNYDKTLGICKLFENSLKELIEGSTDDLYLAIMYFISHSIQMKNKQSCFKLDNLFQEKYMQLLRKKIEENKEVLKQEKTIFGLNKWRAIENENRLLLQRTDLKDGIL